MLWQESEDSFLRHFCKIRRNKITDFYFWNLGLEWPKFTFIRLHNVNNFSLPRFLEEVETFIKLSNISNEDLVIKINDALIIPDSLKMKIKPTGSRLAYLSFDKTKKDPLKNCTLIEASSIDDLKIFWKINSSGRTRQNPFESPLWPVVQSSFQKGTKYFYLLHDKMPVACGAIDKITTSWNLWGLATEKEKQKKGYMTELIRQVFEKYTGNYNVQVNHSELTHYYFLKNCLANEIATETWYKFL